MAGKGKEVASKAQKMASAQSSSRSKKKKWSKGKVKEQLNNAVFFEAEGYKKMEKEIPKTKMISASIISDRLKVNMSVARRAMAELAKKGMIKPVAIHQTQKIYTRIGGEEAAAATKADAAAAKSKK